MKAWRVLRAGAPSEALQLEDIDEPVAGPGEVLVRATATALNYNEVDGCRGRYVTVNPPIPYTLGMEVTGEAIGGEPAFLGRRVVATAVGAFGAHAEVVRCSADMTFDAPEALPGSDAAAFLFPFHLAWLGLHTRGELQAGETVLIHAAAGGVGSAAVQLAREAGARVITTSGGAEKAAFCRQLGADVAIDYRAVDFPAAVLDATDGRGVDVVFDGVGLVDQSLACIARGGRHLVIGFAGGIEAEDSGSIHPRPLCFSNAALLGVLLAYSSNPALRTLVTYDEALQIHASLVALLDAGRIKPIISRRVPFAELPQALDAMERRETIGRVVVEL